MTYREEAGVACEACQRRFGSSDELVASEAGLRCPACLQRAQIARHEARSAALERHRRRTWTIAGVAAGLMGSLAWAVRRERFGDLELALGGTVIVGGTLLLLAVRGPRPDR